MKLIYKKFLPSIPMILLMMLFSTYLLAEEPDWSGYDQLLKATVSKGKLNSVDLMRVDYVKIRNNPEYAKTLKMIANFDTSKLANKNERLAFYINAYNILAIKMVLDHWPVKSIKDIGSLFSSVWKKEVGKINGKTTTLNEVEHEILRTMGEPRIHMAIVCASVSCPDLRAEAYQASKLNAQLDEQSLLFLKNPKKGLVIKGDTVYVSKIFDWFEKDFDRLGGVKSFISQYRKDVPMHSSIDADLNYDWQLNKK